MNFGIQLRTMVAGKRYGMHFELQQKLN
ncbi:hypothetical protein Godav_008714 [Gossypium davidsonii]|uniref:Uncharacterized protein n=2 Tax=Gossypium TaxID=3633 RepID=A0A7J8SAZ1_GOSDV|nr:hypothetical protein [Gossypium davidsonii]MBA0658788.1 hypothetical protein [Gossypium klotzschianum]